MQGWGMAWGVGETSNSSNNRRRNEGRSRWDVRGGRRCSDSREPGGWHVASGTTRSHWRAYNRILERSLRPQRNKGPRKRLKWWPQREDGVWARGVRVKEVHLTWCVCGVGERRVDRQGMVNVGVGSSRIPQFFGSVLLGEDWCLSPRWENQRCGDRRWAWHGMWRLWRARGHSAEDGQEALEHIVPKL